MRLFKSREEKQEIGEARSDFDEFIKAAATGQPGQVKTLAVSFASKPELAALSAKERRHVARTRSVPTRRTCSQTIT